MAPTPSPLYRIAAVLKDHSRWLSSRVALGVTVALFVSAALLAGMASLQRSAADDRVAEQGWVRLSKARLDILGAIGELDTALASSGSRDDAVAAFVARRAAIDEDLADLAKVSPDLAEPVRSLHDSLAAVPEDPTDVERLHIGIAQIAGEVANGSNLSPLAGDLAFADRLAAEVAHLQLADRLIAIETERADLGGDHSYALSIAADLARNNEDHLWRFGTQAISADVPESVRADLTSATTSTEARLVQDAATWAAARAGLDVDAGSVSTPDATAVDAAAGTLSRDLIAMGSEVITGQARQLGLDAANGRDLSVKFFYGIVLCIAAATVILALRRKRSRISDDELRAAASTDRLTGLGNRVHLDEEVALLAERSPEVVLMHIDLDHFKPVNDTYGHAVGDRVLQLSAQRLREVAETHDGIAARLGGDEFVLVLPSIEQKIVDDVTHSLLQSLQSFQIGGLDLTVGASIGVARGVGGVTDLLINADLALYQAKRTGRGQASTFRAEAAAFVSFVRDALIDGKVQVVYQPQVSLRDGRCIGAEVLARLVDSTGSLIPAKDWLGIAEWLGVTGELFEHVVSAVCDELASGPPVHTKLWFNVAPNDLIRPGGTDWVLSQLSRLKLPVSMIGIELTETEAITDPASLAVVLERLKSVGLGLALDDFGARNTPIGHLVDLPVTRVKLDASLIAGIGEDMPPSSWVVKAMAELATRLRIEVMAEGVTSGHQVSLLAKLGVPAAQGYLLGLPGPLDRLPTAVNIRSLLQTSLDGFDAARPVGPLVQLSGNRTGTTSQRDHVARSEVGDRRGGDR